MFDPTSPLFPPVLPSRHGMLAVDDLHTIYWEEVGNPNGVPVLFLHGGPGAGASIGHRRYFDPACYRIVIFDQRGAGRDDHERQAPEKKDRNEAAGDEADGIVN